MRSTMSVLPSDDAPPTVRAAAGTGDGVAAPCVQDRLEAELPSLRAFVVSLGLRSQVDPEDVLQDVAARALRYGGSFDVSRPLGPWLRRMALRVFLDRRAETLREQQRSAELEPGTDTAVSIPDALESREQVERLLRRLSRREREILVRFHSRGEGLREIAVALGMPEGTVKSHLHRARRKLAQEQP